MLQSRVHVLVVREIRAKIGLGRRCVENMVEYDQRQNIVSKCDTQHSQTCLGQSVHSRPLSSLVPQRPISHGNACELSLMEALVRMADNRMGSNMYQCAQLPRSVKNMVL